MASAERKHDRRRRLREAAYYSTGISVYATASILVAALVVDDWLDTDTYFAATGLALFVLGLFLARRQRHLQEAMADLETEEKITVLLSHAAALRDDDKYAMGFNAVGDTVACLRILAFTTAETRSHCAAAACAAIEQLDKTDHPLRPKRSNA